MLPVDDNGTYWQLNPLRSFLSLSASMTVSVFSDTLSFSGLRKKCEIDLSILLSFQTHVLAYRRQVQVLKC